MPGKMAPAGVATKLGRPAGTGGAGFRSGPRMLRR